MYLLWISEDKSHFQIVLRYIEDKLGQSLFPSVYELLSDSAYCFKLLKSILTKYAITGVLREEKIEQIIDRIFMNDALTVKLMKSSIASLI